MALDPNAATIWSDKMLMEYRDAHVFKAGTNQDYEGDVKANGAVKIFTSARPSTAAYTRDSTTITYQRLTPAEQVLEIDNRQHWAIKVDSLEKHIAAMGGRIWEEEIQGGAWELADDVDDFIRDTMIAGIASGNTLNSRTLGVSSMTDNAYDLLVEAEVKLRSNNVPLNTLHAFVPPDFSGLIARDDRFTGFNTPDARRTIRGGLETTIRSFKYHETNNSSVSSNVYTLVFVSSAAFTYAEQLSEMRFIEKTAGDFDERADAELVFGGKVTRPEGIVVCAVEFAN